MSRKIIIIGGSLSGAAVAARIRSLDAAAEIVLFEKGATITYAGTAWPGLLLDDSSTPRSQHNLSADDFQRQYRIDVRTNCEVTAVHRLRRLVDVSPAAGASSKQYREKYDYLVLATGCTAIRPQLFTPGLTGVFTLKSPSDALQVRAFLQNDSVQATAIVGGTPAGLQAASALSSRGRQVMLIEKANHLLPSLDPDMARIVERQLRLQGVDLRLGRFVSEVRREEAQLMLVFDDQSNCLADLTLLTCGFKPESTLALASGLKSGPMDSIQVSGSGQTSDRRIFAVGALASAASMTSGQPVWLPSASSVIRQARQTADFLCGRHVATQPVLGLMYTPLPGLEAGSAGEGESDLLKRQTPYKRTYVIIPGDEILPFLIVKILWSKQSRQLLGAQIVSSAPIDEKLSTLALVIQTRQTVEDLAKLEMPSDGARPGRRNWLALAGQFAQNQLDGLIRDSSIYDLAAIDTSRAALVDVRSRDEFLRGSIPGAINLPLPELVKTLHDGTCSLPTEQPIHVFSETGRQGYLAARQLMQAGRSDVFNLAGGYWLYSRVIGR